MTMNFRTLKTNLEAILASGATAGQYTVFGYQQQAIAASEVLGVKRRVQVFYDSGNFPKSKAALVGDDTVHDITYRVELAVSSAAEGDLTVINDPTSTPAELAAAIAAFQSAASVADDQIDDFIDVIYQILMDARNYDIGTTGPPYIVTDRWVDSIDKSDTVPQGEYVILTANIGFTCQAVETVSGDTGTPADQPAFNITDDIVGDNNEKTGSLVGEDP